MKRIVLALIFGCFSIHSVSAKLVSVDDFFKSRFGNMSTMSYTSSCDSFGYLSAIPERNECTTVSPNGLTCYTDCHCSAEYTNSCTGTGEVGVGETCDGKYASCTCNDSYEVCGGAEVGEGEACTADGGAKYATCSCPASYNQICNGVGEVGVGTACEGKYTACKCSASYQKTCAAAAGSGEPCTADGGYKYSACDWGQYDGTSCRAVVDATPYYNSAEYIEHANAFRGIENTQALIDTHGNSAVPAYGARQYYPYYSTDSDCNISASNEYFSQGNWYLPAAGEILYLIGANFNDMSSIIDHSGLTQTNYTIISNNLEQIFQKSRQHTDYAHRLINTESSDSTTHFWTSSEDSNGYPYVFTTKGHYGKTFSSVSSARYKVLSSSTFVFDSVYETLPAIMLQNCFNKANISVGDIIYSNMSVGTIDSYNYNYATNCSHFPVAMIYWISPDQTLVRAISLRPVKYSNSFDPGAYGTYSGKTLAPFICSSKSDYNSSQWDSPGISNDVWGCSSIKPENPNCITENPIKRKTFTCTPNDGSTEFTDHANAFKGREYTNAILAQHGSNAPAAYEASQFYPQVYSGTGVKNDGYIGKGKWYLPSAGEALYLSGVDFSSMTGITDTSGIIGNTLATVEASLVKGAPINVTSSTPEWFTKDYISTIYTYSDGTASAKTNSTAPNIGGSPRIWTSSEVDAENAYYWDSADGAIKIANKKNPGMYISVRPVIMLKDPDFIGNDAKVGDMVWTTFYNGLQNIKSTDHRPHAPFGIIYWISEDKRIYRIVSVSTIKATSPYNENTGYNSLSATTWLKNVSGVTPVDIDAIPNHPWHTKTCDVNWDSILFNGKALTAAIVAEIGEHGLAAYATTQFYPLNVDPSDANFGQGQWYLPSSGEMMLISGADFEDIGSTVNSAFDGGTTKAIINTALATLSSKGVNTENVLKNAWDWTSSLVSNSIAYCVNTSNRAQVSKWDSHGIRPVLLLENKLPAGAKIGDVVYSNLTYGSADDYDGSKVPVGIVYWVNGTQVRVVNLKYLRFSNQDQAGNFNPATPFTGSANSSDWADSTATYTPIPGAALITSAKPDDLCNPITPCTE